MRRLRWFSAGLGLLAVIAIMAAILAIRQTTQAETQAQVALAIGAEDQGEELRDQVVEPLPLTELGAVGTRDVAPLDDTGPDLALLEPGGGPAALAAPLLEAPAGAAVEAA